MNFALILFILVIITGIAWVADKLVFAPKRKAAGITRMPLWLEYSASFFPVICAVFFLRSPAKKTSCSRLSLPLVA